MKLAIIKIYSKIGFFIPRIKNDYYIIGLYSLNHGIQRVLAWIVTGTKKKTEKFYDDLKFYLHKII